MPNDNSPWGSGGKNGGGNSPWGSGGKGGGGKGPQRPQNTDLDNVIKDFKNKFGKGGGSGRGGRKGESGGLPKSIFLLAGVALVAFSSVFTVQADEEAVILRFGKYTRTAGPGLHFKIPAPFERRMTKRVTRQIETEIGINNGRDITKESLMLTGDKNIVDIDFTVLWRITNLEKYIFNLDDPDNAVKAVAESVMREVIGKNDLDSIITTGREQLRANVRAQVQATLDEYDAGILINDIQFQKTDPPGPVVQAFLDVVNADQEAESFINQAEAYRNKEVLEAEGEAAKIIQDAEAYRESVIAEANGKAERFKAVYKEYKAAPRVTRQRMYLETMEVVYANTDKIVMDGKAGSGVVPYLPLNELNKKSGGK